MKTIDEKFVRKAIINYLSRKGYSRNLKEKETHEHGVDIQVRHNDYSRYFFVEVKGDPDTKKVKFPSSRREVSFVYALGQIITRMKTKSRDYYGVGFPESYERLVRNRIPLNLLKKLNLKVFLVNSLGKVREINWKNLKNDQ